MVASVDYMNSKSVGNEKKVSSFDSRKLTPEDHTLIARKVELTFGEDIPRNWQGEYFTTRFFDALQLAFPEGERMFIESIRNYKSEIKDPTLVEQVKKFNYQEGQHGLGHANFNDLLMDQGINAEAMYETITKAIKLVTKHSPRKFLLATTVAAEHFTATLAEDVYNTDFELFDNADETIASLYAWHALEEAEHKAVAWDVYQEVANGDYLTRSLAMVTIIPVLGAYLALTVPMILAKDKKLTDVSEMKKGYKRFLGKNGLFRRIAPPILDYFKPGFHPWSTGHPKHYAEWKSAYAESGDMKQAYAHVRKLIAEAA
ncbi:MAG: metal-dependent hydrolase [Pseudomonadales bacterium]|nr:metal-dependent hydrolase [Pseudomonadales bacterium]